MKLSLSILASVAMLLSGCNQKSKMEKEGVSSLPQESLRKDSVSASAKFTAPVAFKRGLGKLYEGYATIESALAHDDFEKAKEAFQSMHGILHVIQADGLDSSAKAHWVALDASFMEVLHPMASSKDIAEMRDHLIDLSPLILAALENYGAESKARAFLFRCPKARSNQGADWLQGDSTLLMNPYFGKDMLSCGSFIRELRLF